MFKINFLPGREFEIDYLSKNYPKLWEKIETEIKETINEHISMLVFCIFIAFLSTVIVNIQPGSGMPCYIIKSLFNTVIFIGSFIFVYAKYKEIISINNTYFDFPSISKEIVSEMRTAESILREEKILNEIVSTNIIKKNSKKIIQNRL